MPEEYKKKGKAKSVNERTSKQRLQEYKHRNIQGMMSRDQKNSGYIETDHRLFDRLFHLR